MRYLLGLLLALFILPAAAIQDVRLADLPPEALLPIKPRGYYREYTVPTPGLRHRGARRIVSGNIAEHYYTNDHYRTFRRIRE